jgi:ribosomal protein S28E/S33
VDDVRLENLRAHRLVGRLQVPRQGLDLVPQRLAVDHLPLARHLPALTFQGQMVEVLGRGGLHGELHRVATARDELVGAGRRHHRAIAATVVLGPSVRDDHEVPLDDRDLLRVLGLSRHRREIPRAGRTAPLLRRQLVNLFDHRQLRLFPRPMPASHRRLRNRGFLRLRPFFRGLRKKTALHLRQLLAQALELQLQATGLRVPAQGGDLANQLLHTLVQTVVLFLE